MKLAVNFLLGASLEAMAEMFALASLVHVQLTTAIARGFGDQDWSVLGRLAADNAGLPPR